MSNEQHQWTEPQINQARIGEILRLARTHLRLSFRDIATEANLSATQVLRMEKGETEYPITKLHSVCMALGLPTSEVIEYGFSGSIAVPKVQLEAEDDIQKLLKIARSRGENEEICLKRAAHFIDYLVLLVSRSLMVSVSSATGLSTGSTLPINSFSDALESFTGALWDMDNAERKQTLTSLRRNPYRKLRALGLVNVGILDAVTAKDLAWRLPTDPEPAVAATKKNALAAARVSQTLLDERIETLSIEGMPKESSKLELLMARIQRVTKKRGAKATLAKELGVTRQAVDNWLTGKAKPQLDTYLRLMDWVDAAEERQQKDSASVSAPAEPKTRTRKQSNETKSESNPREP